jgi:hypothetical protein
MNIEFLLLIVDYFKTLRRREFLLEWMAPLIIGVLCAIIKSPEKDVIEILKALSSGGISLLGVLIGFSIAVLTILVTSSSENIQEIKNTKTDFIKSHKRLSLFDLLLTNYAYSVVAEVLVLIVNILIASSMFSFEGRVQKFIIFFDVFLLSHVLLLTLRNITNFYFILSKK